MQKHASHKQRCLWRADDWLCAGARTPPSTFKQFLDPVRARMDTRLSQGSFARIDELVGHTGRHQDNLPSSHFQRGVAHCIGSLAFMDHKHLLIGMAVQRRPLPWCQVSEVKEILVAPYLYPSNTYELAPSGSKSSRLIT